MRIKVIVVEIICHCLVSYQNTTETVCRAAERHYCVATKKVAILLQTGHTVARAHLHAQHCTVSMFVIN